MGGQEAGCTRIGGKSVVWAGLIQQLRMFLQSVQDVPQHNLMLVPDKCINMSKVTIATASCDSVGGGRGCIFQNFTTVLSFAYGRD